jgi:hypothetical protein
LHFWFIAHFYVDFFGKIYIRKNGRGINTPKEVEKRTYFSPEKELTEEKSGLKNGFVNVFERVCENAIAFHGTRAILITRNEKKEWMLCWHTSGRK